MTHYATCTNCAVDKATCPRREQLREALKGLYIYSLKFKCSDRQPMFLPGQRVQFHWSSWENDEYGSSELPLLYHGTVIRERGAKFVVQVDDGPDAHGEGIPARDLFTKNDQLLIKARPADMYALDEPTQVVCPTCYWVEGEAEDRCYMTTPTSYVPTGCIRPKDALDEQGGPTG